MSKTEERAAGVHSTGRPSAVRLSGLVSSDDANTVFRRKVPGAETEVRELLHPFWWSTLRVRTRAMFLQRGAAENTLAGTTMHVLVNAQTGRGFIADFEPAGDEVAASDWVAALEQLGGSPVGIDAQQAELTARALVRTKVVKTVKLGMRIEIATEVAPRLVLKPNWLVTGRNTKFAARFLVDGLDGTHYVIRAEKL